MTDRTDCVLRIGENVDSMREARSAGWRTVRAWSARLKRMRSSEEGRRTSIEDGEDTHTLSGPSEARSSPARASHRPDTDIQGNRQDSLL